MPTEKRYDELRQGFPAEMQQYIQEGFRTNDCFPFVFQNIIETRGGCVRPTARIFSVNCWSGPEKQFEL